MKQVYLTRRNLQTLINKLDRNKREGESASACTIVKQDTVHPIYPCSDVICITAVEDAAYYIDRHPGAIFPEDDPAFGS